MKKIKNLGTALSKFQQMNISGGDVKEDDFGDDGDTCCDSTADCPKKDGKTASCSSHYTCSAGNSHKCFWVSVS